MVGDEVLDTSLSSGDDSLAEALVAAELSEALFVTVVEVAGKVDDSAVDDPFGEVSGFNSEEGE